MITSIMKSVGTLCLFVVLSFALERFGPGIGSGIGDVLTSLL